MKRFYKFVSLGNAPKGHSILLDGKPVKTPGRNTLQTEHTSLANAILQEWNGQGDKIVVSSMPLTQLLSTKIDRVEADRASLTVPLLKYMDTDLLCYRAVQPPEMARRQAQSWDLWLAWFAGKFGALETTETLKALKQPAAIRESVEEFIENLDDDHFTILQLVTPLSGSLVLGLAFVEGAAMPEQVFAAARVEETYKAELYNEKQYGPDPGQEKQDKAMQADLEAAAKFLDLLS